MRKWRVRGLEVVKTPVVVVVEADDEEEAKEAAGEVIMGGGGERDHEKDDFDVYINSAEEVT